MRSWGWISDLGVAFAKAKLGAFLQLPSGRRRIFVSVKDSDKRAIIEVARRLSVMLGYEVVATAGTHQASSHAQVSPARQVFKIADGARPNVLDIVKNREVHLIINTPSGRGARTDEGRIRGAASVLNIPVITTMSGATALLRALEAYRGDTIRVKALQEYVQEAQATGAGV